MLALLALLQDWTELPAQVEQVGKEVYVTFQPIALSGVRVSAAFERAQVWGVEGKIESRAEAGVLRFAKKSEVAEIVLFRCEAKGLKLLAPKHAIRNAKRVQRTKGRSGGVAVTDISSYSTIKTDGTLSPMRLTVLGAGTCALSPTRGSSGYWVETGALKIRLDAGPGSVHAMARFGLPWKEVTHQIVTHFHLDHVHDLPALLFALKYGRPGKRTAPLTVVGPKGIEALTCGFVGIYRMKFLEQEFPVVFRELEPPAELDLGGARLRVAKTPHTPESLAVRLDEAGASLGYTGDTQPSPDLAAFFAGVDALVAECSFVDDARGTPHLTADQAADLAAAAGAKRLVAVHSYFDPEAERLAERLARRFRGRITVPRDGESLDVGARGASRRRRARTPRS